jgi:hypothetical protein
MYNYYKMGNGTSKPIHQLPENLYGMIIYSFDTKLHKTSNYDNKINELLGFVLGEKYDIVCLQGLSDSRSFNHIKEKIDNYNLKCDDVNDELYNNAKLLYFPKNNNNNDSGTINQSISIEQDEIMYDTLTICKHNIYSMAAINIPSHICTKHNSFCAINTLIHGNMVSIYNITLQPDYMGLSNNKIRLFQLNLLKDAMSVNQKCLESENIKNCVTKNIHIVCIQSNIFEFKNNDKNPEYTKMIEILQCKNTFNYVQNIKNNKNIPLITNHILLSLLNNNIYIYDSDMKSNKLAIRNSFLKTNMKLFDECPITTQFAIIKNIITTSSEPIDSDDDEMETTEQIELTL